MTVRAVVAPAPTLAAARSVEQPAPPPAPLPDSAIAGLGAFQVQIAALGSEAEAQRFWDVVSARHAGIIEGRDRIIIRADRGDRIVYRLRMGDYRILFDVEGGVIVIRRIGNRKDVYD